MTLANVTLVRIRDTLLPLILLIGCPSWAIGCSSSTGGSSETAGRSAASGGAPGSGGSTLGGTSGGATLLGGNQNSGGQNGGVQGASGGVQGASGGAASGGAHAGNGSGGSQAGGVASGGSHAGGEGMGGRSASTGGTSSGGTSGAAGAAQSGAGGSAGASGAFCSPCVGSSDCASGAYCVGGLNPRCGKACTVDTDCGANASSGSCAIITAGGGLTPGHAPAGIAVRSCQPVDSICGNGKTRDGLACNDTWSNYAKSFFSSTCIGSCHRHDAAFDTVDKVRTSVESIRFMVDTGAMPQGQTLSDAERRRLLTWLACGAQ